MSTAISHPPVPSPFSLPFLGHFFEFQGDTLGFLEKAARNFGDIVRLQIMQNEIFLVSNPDYIKKILIDDNDSFSKDKGLKLLKTTFLGDGLLTTEGSVHRQQRKDSAGAFNKKRIHSYAEPMIKLTHRHIEQWQHNEVRDLDQEMMQLTAKIAAKTLFNTDLEDEVEEIGTALSDVLELVKFLVSPLVETVMSLPLPVTNRVKNGMQRLDQTVYHFIDEHLQSGKDQGDFLSMLIKTRQENSIDFTKPEHKKRLRDEALTIFLAGHETTSNALMWSWYLLSQNRDKEEKMLSELNSVLGGRLPTLEDVEKLSYTRQVMAEAMRLFPPAWAIGRHIETDYELGGYILPRGSEIWMSQYVVHRDPRFYDYPLAFMPERFAREEVEKRPRFSYFPFSAGPRNCIGEQFAWLEGVLLLAIIAPRFKFKLLPDHKVEPEPLVTLRAKHGLKMKIEHR